MGVLVTARHNDLRDGVADLTGKAFTPSHMRDYPLIFSGPSVMSTKDAPSGYSGTTYQARAPPLKVTDQQGDLLIRDLACHEH